MEPKELCKKFLDADKIINGEYYGITMLEEIIKDPEFNKYCPNNKCETDMKLNCLSEYLFNQLGIEIKDEYYEYFMMWLSDKLFKIAKDDDKSQNNDITLNEAYEKYLKNNIVKFNYWSFLDIKEGLKEVDLMYMKQFYKLLNHICEAIVYYSLNEDDIKKFISNSTDCYNQYSSLYDSVPKCSSYLHLLDNLKKTYEDFKNSVHNEIKNEYRDLAERLQTLTIKNTDSYFVGKFKAFDFSDEKCKPKTKKKPNKLKEPQESGKTHQNGPKDSKSEQNALDSKNLNADGGGGEKEDPNRGKGSESTNKGDSGDRSVGVQGGQGKSSDKTGGAGGILDGGPSDQGSKSGGSDSGGNGGSNDGSKETRDQAVTDSSEKFNGGWLGNLGMSFNLTDYMLSVSGVYESSKNILTNTANQVSNAYNSAMTIAQDTYDKTVTAVKDAYDNTITTVKGAYSATTNYISDGFNSITNQLSSLGSFSQLGDNQSGSNSLGGGVDTSDQSQHKSPLPLQSLPPSPSPPQSTPQPQSNQIQDPSQTPPDPQAPSPSITLPLSPSNPQTLSDPPSPKSIDPQPIPTHISKSSDQQIAPTDGNRVSQIPLSAQGTLSSSSTDPSAQGNESTTGIVKMNEKPSIWCIGTNNKCGITGISIIVISVSIILTIIYKYLSLGCTSKSKRKKSVKKVINSIGGKRPIQIIIKSYDRNKDLKPVINSVDRKKYPLLNIYKLMQADPVPFINVFFLLIFFVYKRKYDFLEL
ncbi:PIR protein CIR protein [Plasmodium vinckei brucechwatti]|uniref:PIR protein CIR protein n=1 Tax=Plasmodium vinckei brucechwatti TaxID=119398 RepID=A0A6V7SUV0_PLAVN|nr:PIR protein CIR protein [Plasmodium vinckei brucechwatti]